ncbi:MAG: contact-dependent growth inhibition system immunity protein [Myxococcota bacterium]
MPVSDWKTRPGRLRHFFEAYFNQDWDLWAPTELEVMDVIAHHERRELQRTQQLVADLRWLAEEPGTSQELWARIVSEYGSEYNGNHIGTDARKWLRTMAARLESQLGPKSVKT